METKATMLSDEIRELGLERYVLELEMDGLTVVPAAVSGVDPDVLDTCQERLLEAFTRVTGGCPVSMENGPEQALVWPKGQSSFMRGEGAPEPTQILIQQLMQIDRSFRELCVNPVVDALIDHLIGRFPDGRKARRLSSTNSFMKWQGDYGYGETLGLHADQGVNPRPWGTTALTANATWALSDYSLDNGALAYVPGSHRFDSHPSFPSSVELAKPVDCERGDVIIWHGATWHGAYPKTSKGLRLNAIAYYRHQSVLPQENLKVTMHDEAWDDCSEPALMRELIGFDDPFPYTAGTQGFPRVAD